METLEEKQLTHIFFQFCLNASSHKICHKEDLVTEVYKLFLKH